MLIVEKINSADQITSSISNRGRQHLNTQNWVKADGVHASFNIYHDGNHIHLHFQVREKQVRAVNTGYHSPVWEDSCVEFFFSFKGDENRYYNFEFNAIGTILAAYGKDRNDRLPLPGNLLDNVETYPSLGREPLGIIDGPVHWDLQIKIPKESFLHTPVDDLSGVDGYANFYKCGDKLETPHYLSWNPVLTDKPDFHTPRFFRHISFF